MRKPPEPLNLFPEELGYLIGSIPAEGFARMQEDMPKLYVKLMMAITKHYQKNPNFAEQANKDMEGFRQQLKGLTKTHK